MVAVPGPLACPGRWSLSVEVYPLKFICWSSSVEVYLLKFICWSLSVEVYLLKFICWSLSVEVLLLKFICWIKYYIMHLFPFHKFPFKLTYVAETRKVIDRIIFEVENYLFHFYLDRFKGCCDSGIWLFQKRVTTDI